MICLTCVKLSCHRHRKRLKITNMPRSTFNAQPRDRCSQTAKAASAAQCVIPVPILPSLTCHSSACLIHVLPRLCAPFISHTSHGCMQNQTTQTGKSIRHQNTFTYCDAVTFSPLPPARDATSGTEKRKSK